MWLTDTQAKELLELIDVMHLGFAANNITPRYLTDHEKRVLRSYGINPEMTRDYVDDAFKFGMLSQALGREAAKNMTYNEFKRYVRSKKFLPLDVREKAALESLKYQAFHAIKGLGNKIGAEFNAKLIDVDKRQRAEYEKVIEGAAKKAIVDRDSLKQMAIEIGKKTGDWARDLDRISDFVLHEAHDSGRVHEIKRMDGDKARVYKHVFDQACKYCVRLYLESGVGSKPRTFTVDELIANGSNIGRKADDWKAVIGGTHPWCRCEVERVPEFSEWSPERGQFVLKKKPVRKEITELVTFKRS